MCVSVFDPKLPNNRGCFCPVTFLCDEAYNDRFFSAVRRGTKKFGQDQKLPQGELRQFELIPALGLKIAHEFEEQRLVAFIRSYSLL